MKNRGNTSVTKILRLAFPRFFMPPPIGRRCRPMRRVAVGACAPDLGDPVTQWFENLCVSVSLWQNRGLDRSVIPTLRPWLQRFRHDCSGAALRAAKNAGLKPCATQVKSALGLRR